MKASYLIPSRNFDWVQRKIEQLNKRAVKLGVSTIKFEVTGEEMRPIGDDGRITLEPHARYHERFYHVDVEGDAPKLNGWIFVATLQHVQDNGNSSTIILAVPGESVPEEYRATDGRWCDHCQTKRYRTDTFIVKKDPEFYRVGGHFEATYDVVYKQVGRQCLKDFLGHVSPHKLADWATDLGLFEQALRGAENEGEYQAGWARDWRYVHTEAYLSYVAESITRLGWVSRKSANENGGTATSADAVRMMEAERDDKSLAPSKASFELALKAIEWGRAELPFLLEKKPDDDFIYNLLTVAKLDWLGERMLGIAAALIPVYLRYNKPVAEGGAGAHIGTPGQRGVFTLKVLEIRNIVYANGGEGVLVKFEDEHGNAAAWFTGAGQHKFTPGNTYTVKATVKRHDVFKGRNETSLNRVQIIEGN